MRPAPLKKKSRKNCLGAHDWTCKTHTGEVRSARPHRPNSRPTTPSPLRNDGVVVSSGARLNRVEKLADLKCSFARLLRWGIRANIWRIFGKADQLQCVCGGALRASDVGYWWHSRSKFRSKEDDHNHCPVSGATKHESC